MTLLSAPRSCTPGDTHASSTSRLTYGGGAPDLPAAAGGPPGAADEAFQALDVRSLTKWQWSRRSVTFWQAVEGASVTVRATVSLAIGKREHGGRARGRGAVSWYRQ